MNEREKELDEILKEIVNEISITPTMLDKAITSYEAVGTWLGEGIKYDMKIFPQGSMNLGTTNKPITDKDDYDVDLVCLLENGKELVAREIKHIVGDRLKEHKIYREKILEEGEGKRCWKMQYDEFHMDILPCVPRYIYKEPDITEIRLTHKKDSYYEDRYSNPTGYRKWFEKCMEKTLKIFKEAYAIENKMEIIDVPIYRIKTPLQMAIQLLKRHRDIYFQKDDENAPISVIITTLAAKAYTGEESVYETLVNVLSKMSTFIEMRNGVYWIQNPVMPLENFADKWQECPQKKIAFENWIQKAREDFITNPLNLVGIDKIGDSFKKSLGEAPVKRALNNCADKKRNARDNKELYSTGLLTGIATQKVAGATLIKGHTFFGK